MNSPRLPLAGSTSAPARRRIHRVPAARAVLVAALSVVVAGCGIFGPAPSAPGPTASPTAPPDPATVYAAIEQQVLAIRGLDEKVPVEPKILDEAALTDYVKAQFREGQPGVARRGQRAPPQGPWPLPVRRVARGPLHRPAEQPGRGPLQPEGQDALRRLAVGWPRADRKDDLRPRIHPRAPGPELRHCQPQARRDRGR